MLIEIYNFMFLYRDTNTQYKPLFWLSNSFYYESDPTQLDSDRSERGLMQSVALLSDIHLREEHRSEIIEALQEIKNDVLAQTELVHTFIIGDLIEDSSATQDREKLHTLKDLFEKWPSEIKYCLGNHDIETLSKSTVGEILGQDSFYRTIEISGQPFAYLDSTKVGGGARGTLGVDQQNWLQESIPEDAVVLSHHPLGRFDITENAWFQEYPERAYLWDRKEVLDILTDTAKATVSGHIHQAETIDRRGLTHYSLNAVSKETPDKSVSGNYALYPIEENPQLHYHTIQTGELNESL